MHINVEYWENGWGEGCSRVKLVKVTGDLVHKELMMVII